VLAMPDEEPNTTRPVESQWVIAVGDGMLRLQVPSRAGGVIIDRHCVVHVVELMC
jgi:hypothetical protein